MIWSTGGNIYEKDSENINPAQLFRRTAAKCDYEAMKQADFIGEAGLRMPVSYLNNNRNHNIEFNVEDEIQAALTFCMPSHGRPPRAENEIVASDRALRDLGVAPETGVEVVIEFTAHGTDYRLPMIVSGWYEAVSDQVSIIWASDTFCDAYPDIFQYTYPQDHEAAGTYFFDFMAKDPMISPGILRDKMYDLIRSHGGDPENISAPNYMAASVNNVTNPSLNPKMAGAAAFLILLFIFCGYLLIYNVFDIAVMQEIRRYGLYRTIGMSRKQVKMLIDRQAAWLFCIGAPLGLIVGYFTGKAALPVIADTFSNSYANVTMDITPSPSIFAGAAALTALTVFLSTRKPVRMAADTPPIEAFHYVERASGKRISRRSAPGASIPRLAWSNLGRNKRRLWPGRRWTPGLQCLRNGGSWLCPDGSSGRGIGSTYPVRKAGKRRRRTGRSQY